MQRIKNISQLNEEKPKIVKKLELLNLTKKQKEFLGQFSQKNLTNDDILALLDQRFNHHNGRRDKRFAGALDKFFIALPYYKDLLLLKANNNSKNLRKEIEKNSLKDLYIASIAFLNNKIKTNKTKNAIINKLIWLDPEKFHLILNKHKYKTLNKKQKMLLIKSVCQDSIGVSSIIQLCEILKNVYWVEDRLKKILVKTLVNIIHKNLVAKVFQENSDIYQHVLIFQDPNLAKKILKNLIEILVKKFCLFTKQQKTILLGAILIIHNYLIANNFELKNSYVDTINKKFKEIKRSYDLLKIGFKLTDILSSFLKMKKIKRKVKPSEVNVCK